MLCMVKLRFCSVGLENFARLAPSAGTWLILVWLYAEIRHYMISRTQPKCKCSCKCIGVMNLCLDFPPTLQCFLWVILPYWWVSNPSFFSSICDDIENPSYIWELLSYKLMDIVFSSDLLFSRLVLPLLLIHYNFDTWWNDPPDLQFKFLHLVNGVAYLLAPFPLY